jgi:TRAP transporter TAXI family solute receptor
MTRLGFALAAAIAAGSAATAQDLAIATGGTGGPYYPYGGGLAEVINRHVEGAQATAEVTGASVENMALIARGETDLAIALADTVFGAANGTIEPFTDRPVDARALASIYPNAVHVVTMAGSGIESLADLAGKRVSVGAPGSGTEVNANAILEAAGLSYDDIDEQRLNFNETADALRDGDIDAGFWSVGPPTSSIMNLAATSDISIIPITEGTVDAAVGIEPVFAPYTLQAGLYEGMEAEVPTISIPNVLVVSADMDEELAYQITRAMFENVGELIAVHPAANDTTVEFTMNATPIPLHPGAIRYFEEAGASIPDRLRP